MNRWRQALQEQGLTYENTRSNGTRLVEIRLTESVSDASDAADPARKTCDPCGTCDPVCAASVVAGQGTV